MNSVKSLKDKVAIVTGSSRGIGARLAKTLAQVGASVIVNYTGKGSVSFLAHSTDSLYEYYLMRLKWIFKQ